MRADSKRILIIGGGVAGPVLAIFLQRAGLSPQIFEAASGPLATGGALGLAANGMNVLAAAGVIESVRDASVTPGNWIFENQSGRTLASSSSGDIARYGQAGVMITRAALHSVLVAHAEKEGIPVHYNKHFVGLEDALGEPVVAHFADGSSAIGDLVVGADGIRSEVRQVIMPNAPKPAYTGMMAPG
ncbi:MAG: FAD-dependent monooxygenase, partial [Chthonomonadales bacterium]